MNANDLTAASTEAAQRIVQGELTTRRRWFYRILLVVTSVIVTGLLSLWITEPKPLPLRLHVTFGAMVAIGLGWITVLTWLLTRRNCPTAMDRVATGWMAMVACTVFLVGSVVIALLRGSVWTALGLGATGLTLVGAALWALRCAYAFRRQLREKLEALRH